MTKVLSLLIVFFVVLSCSDSKVKVKVIEGDKYYDKAYDFLVENKQDSAFVNFSKAKDEFIKYNLRSKAGNCLVNMSLIQSSNSDFFGAQETALVALRFLDEDNEDDRPDLASLYNNLAITSHQLKSYDQALDYYDEAIHLSSDDYSRLMFINNKAVVYKDLQEFDQAISLWQKEMNLAVQTGKLDLITRFKDNLAFTQFLKNSSFNAEQQLLRVLEDRKENKDLEGLNASYTHLSHYYEGKNPALALSYAKEMYRNSTKRNAADDRIEALQRMVLLDSDFNEKQSFKRLVSISDSLKMDRAKAKNQFAVVRYESLKNLNKFLSAQAENESRKNHIIKQYAIIIGLFFAILILIMWYTRRRRLLEQEKAIEIANTELSMSKKVHDVVANGLYQIMVELENKADVPRDYLLERLDDLYEGSRDLSHSFALSKVVPIHVRISEMLSSFSSDETKVFIVGNNETVWANITTEAQEEIFTVLRELMVNMRKHAKATLVSVKFELEDRLNITYTDNGIGLKDGMSSNSGKGLQNMENRIVGIDGQIKFDKNPKGGLITIISI